MARFSLPSLSLVVTTNFGQSPVTRTVGANTLTHHWFKRRDRTPRMLRALPMVTNLPRALTKVIRNLPLRSVLGVSRKVRLQKQHNLLRLITVR